MWPHMGHVITWRQLPFRSVHTGWHQHRYRHRHWQNGFATHLHLCRCVSAIWTVLHIIIEPMFYRCLCLRRSVWTLYSTERPFTACTHSLWEGNVFSYVCLSAHRGGVPLVTTHRHVQTCSLGTSLDMFKPFQYVIHTSIIKRAVGLRLKGLLGYSYSKSQRFYQWHFWSLSCCV